MSNITAESQTFPVDTAAIHQEDVRRARGTVDAIGQAANYGSGINEPAPHDIKTALEANRAERAAAQSSSAPESITSVPSNDSSSGLQQEAIIDPSDNGDFLHEEVPKVGENPHE